MKGQKHMQSDVPRRHSRLSVASESIFIEIPYSIYINIYIHIYIYLYICISCFIGVSVCSLSIAVCCTFADYQI